MRDLRPLPAALYLPGWQLFPPLVRALSLSTAQEPNPGPGMHVLGANSARPVGADALIGPQNGRRPTGVSRLSLFPFSHEPVGLVHRPLHGVQNILVAGAAAQVAGDELAQLLPGVLLAGACWGALSGAVIGGVSGGLTSMANGGSFLEGFEDGAFSGALAGAICGAAFAGLGQLGAVCGKSIKCISPFGKAIRGTAAVTTAISIAMGSFDTLALADLAFGSGTIYDLNSKLHSNTAYNIFQTGVTALAVFTGGMTGTMKCFIAGTLIAIETGFAGIESIKPGDLVLSTNADTMESGYKKVLEKYVRKTRELVHIIAGGEEIVSTPDHPYYVAGRGFVNACQLCIGSPLLDADGRVLETEQIYKESLEEDEEVTVYNFQVEEWHTYHVGEMEVLVHNAEYETSYGKSSEKLNWDAIVSKKGETRVEHIKRHTVQNNSRETHSVFNGNPIDMVNDAWEQRHLVEPISDGMGGTIYNIPYKNAGYESGYINTGAQMDYITIVTLDESTDLITAFPSFGDYHK